MFTWGDPRGLSGHGLLKGLFLQPSPITTFWQAPIFIVISSTFWREKVLTINSRTDKSSIKFLFQSKRNSTFILLYFYPSNCWVYFKYYKCNINSEPFINCSYPVHLCSIITVSFEVYNEKLLTLMWNHELDQSCIDIKLLILLKPLITWDCWNNSDCFRFWTFYGCNFFLLKAVFDQLSLSHWPRQSIRKERRVEI